MADRRDTEATERDEQARTDFDDVADRLGRLSRQIVGRLARIAHATVDPHDWPDLAPAALAHLDEYAAEQRRLAALDLEDVTALLHQLDAELSHTRQARHAAARNRRASADDRDASGRNRRDAAHDRSDSARDRGQAVIEREQVDTHDLSSDDTPGTSHLARDRHSTPAPTAVTTSSQRLSDSRTRIDRTLQD